VDSKQQQQILQQIKYQEIYDKVKFKDITEGKEYLIR